MYCPVLFHERGHTYTLKSSGKLVPGTTTIVGLLHKEFLVPWAAKMAVTYIEANWDRLWVDREAVLKEAKTAHRRKAEAGRDNGTNVHSLLETWVNARIRGAQFALPVEEYPAFGPFLEWEKEAKPKWLYSEMIVGSSKHEFGGTFDAAAVIDGAVTIVDFKTSNFFGWDMALQLAGYQIAVEEMGFVAKNRLVLMLTKQGEFITRPITTPLDLDRQAFLGLREVQRWKSYVNSIG